MAKDKSKKKNKKVEEVEEVSKKGKKGKKGKKSKGKKVKKDFKMKAPSYEADVPELEKKGNDAVYLDEEGDTAAEIETVWMKPTHGKQNSMTLGYTAKIVATTTDLPVGLVFMRSVAVDGGNLYRTREQSQIIDVFAETKALSEGKESSKKYRKKVIEGISNMDRNTTDGNNNRYSDYMTGLVIGITTVEGKEIGNTGKHYQNYSYGVIED